VIRDLVFRENTIHQTLDFLSREIVDLEDEQSTSEHKMLRKYSINAGIHSIAMPNIIHSEMSKVSSVLTVKIEEDSKSTTPFTSSEKPPTCNTSIPSLSQFNMNSADPSPRKQKESKQPQ
jgi:hypothetical protein